MNWGTSAFRLGSSLASEFQSNHSYRRACRSAGAYGFVQVISRWKNGNRWNMPAGRSSPESTACSTPSLDKA
jgi:hypothetical protein